MKPMGLVVGAVCGVLALAATVAIGRYRPVTAVAASAASSSAAVQDDGIGPPVAPNGPHPSATIEKTEYDFGTLTVGDKGEHVFTIKNNGAAPLALMAREEDTTCQCTFGKLGKEAGIAPGETVDVTVSWQVKQRVDEFRHRATIRTNDPNRRKIDLIITGKIDEPILVRPGYILDLGQLSPDKPTSLTALVFSTVVPEFEIKAVKSSDPLITATWAPVSPEKLRELRQSKVGYEVTVTAAPGIPVGQFAGSLTLELSTDVKPTLEFQLKGFRSGPIEFLGPAYRQERTSLVMGEFPASRGKVVTVFVSVAELEGELQLTSFEAQSGRPNITLIKDPKSNPAKPRYQLRVEIPPGEPLDRRLQQADEVLLRFNHPLAPEVKLKLEYMASPEGSV
jgi:hypothetical protein